MEDTTIWFMSFIGLDWYWFYENLRAFCLRPKISSIFDIKFPLYKIIILCYHKFYEFCNLAQRWLRAMKIEKISDNQIKFVFSQADLASRDMQLGELAYGSVKVQELFNEIAERAFLDYGFQTMPGNPLIMEAIPSADGGIMVIMTKITNVNDLEGTALPSLFSNLGSMQNIIQNIFQNKGAAPFGQMPFGGQNQSFSGPLPFPVPAPAKRQPIDQSQAIFRFDSLDQAAKAAARINSKDMTQNSLYKYDAKFYLVIDNSKKQKLNQAAGNILSEYGAGFSTREMSKMYLQEHGEVIIKDDAIGILTTYLS